MSHDKSQKKSPFASYHQRTLQVVPGYPGESAVIRKLNDARLARAQEAVRTKLLKHVQRIGGMEVMGIAEQLETKTLSKEVLEQARKNNEERAARIKADPYLAYDRDALILEGMVSWSFTLADGSEVPITAEMVEDLEDEVKEYFGRNIFKMARPNEADTKNASAPSSDN